MISEVSGSLTRVSAFIAGTLGLHFPRERWSDLRRGLAGAARESGFEDVGAYTASLLSRPLTKFHMQLLARHLTVGETYFFRDRTTFEVLGNTILPQLINSRRGVEQRLRLWSAGCSSGEEAYSLAILLRQLLPDLADWRVTILASDINTRFMRKAAAGCYGEWSFRSAPPGLKERYFMRDKDGNYSVIPEVREMVTFQHLNLVEDAYPSLATNTNAVDLIVCRNVLMYFAPSQIVGVVAKLHNSLIDGGWLSISASEASGDWYPQFVQRSYPGAIFYQKAGPARSADEEVPPASAREDVSQAATASKAARPRRDAASALDAAASLYERGLYSEAAELLLASSRERQLLPQEFSLVTRALANQGKLADAREWCSRWVAADKLNASSHYILATIFLEEGDPGGAQAALNRAIYLDQDFVLAHVALGNLSRSRGRTTESERHFRNARWLLARKSPDDILPESDGLTASRLNATISALTAMDQ